MLVHCRKAFRSGARKMSRVYSWLAPFLLPPLRYMIDPRDEGYIMNMNDISRRLHDNKLQIVIYRDDWRWKVAKKSLDGPFNFAVLSAAKVFVGTDEQFEEFKRQGKIELERLCGIIGF